MYFIFYNKVNNNYDLNKNFSSLFKISVIYFFILYFIYLCCLYNGLFYTICNNFNKFYFYTIYC